MEEKTRCQSCGMPLEEQFGNLGTNADGSLTFEYCSFCFQKGSFTQPNQTLEEMIQSSVSFMSSNLGFTAEKADELSRSIIPRLRRWSK